MKETLSFGRKRYGKDFWALRDINLEVERGTTLGVMGRNGAGKSTLLNIIAGIRQPTSGTVEVNGRLVALSGLGAGFNAEFTGRENVMMNGLILGIERQEMLERFDDIVDFADLGEFIDQPIKTYSSGMRSRLGFAVAANVEPDVLILDETLAAGDAVTKDKAMEKMYELRDSGTTILLVSHGMGTIEDFCTEAILLNEGRLIAAGGTTEIIEQYEALAAAIRKSKKNEQRKGGQRSDHDAGSGEAAPQEGAPTFGKDPDFERRVAPLRSGTGEARIQGIVLLDERNHPVETVPSGATVTVRTYLEYMEAVEASQLIITLHDKADPERIQTGANGHAPAIAGELFSVSTALGGINLKNMEQGRRVTVDFTFKVSLRKGRYGISAGVRARNQDSYLDKVELATAFRIARSRERKSSSDAVHLPIEIKVHSSEDGQRGGLA
ncbi:MAG: ABC transporter ATP-binding protein [Actinomycetota bacterium]|nr:ABC transporter ATP-binding protein [Actinomycetota bacterium]